MKHKGATAITSFKSDDCAEEGVCTAHTDWAAASQLVSGNPWNQPAAGAATCRALCEDSELRGGFVYRARSYGNDTTSGKPCLRGTNASCTCAGLPRPACPKGSKPAPCTSICSAPSHPASVGVTCARRRGWSLPGLKESKDNSWPAADAKACEAICLKRPRGAEFTADDCVAWSFTARGGGRGGKCWLKNLVGRPERDDAELASLTPAASIALAPDAAEGVVAKLPMEYAPMQEGEAVAGTAQCSVGPYHATAIRAVMASANSTCSYDNVSLGKVLKLKTDDASCATWTEPDLYPPPHTASATEVYAVDCTAATNATKLAAATLQGVVNSDQASGARAYLLLAADQPSVGIAGWDRFWLQTFRKRSLMPTSRTTLTPEQFFGKFADAYDAVVVVDTEHLFHTINIATMIAASEERSIVLTPEQLPTLGKGKNVTDLRGRWKSSVAMYSWALQKLYLTGKLAQGTIAYYHPYWLAHHLRDYLIAQKVFVFYISVHDGVAGTALMHEIMTKTAHGTPTQAVSVIGFIGGGPAEDANAYDEYSGVGLMGNYGKVSTCADWSTNLSYLSSMRHAAKLIESAVAAYRGRVATALSAEQRVTPLNKSKVYLSLGVVESGDAPVYWQDRQWQVWNDTKRGSLPISWGMGKGVFEISPAIALYFIEQASGNDYLYGAISGLAYAHPYRSLMGSLPDFEPTWNAYWQRASCYLKRLGATTTGAYTDSWKPFIRAEKDPITKSISKACGAQCETLVLGMGRDAGLTIANGNYYINDTQVSHVLTRWPANFSATTKAYNVRWLASDIEAQLAAPGGPMPAPGFLQAMALSWAYGPTEMAEVVAMLPEHVQLVSMQRYSELSRAAAAMKADDEELAAVLPTVATASGDAVEAAAPFLMRYATKVLECKLWRGVLWRVAWQLASSCCSVLKATPAPFISCTACA